MLNHEAAKEFIPAGKEKHIKPGSKVLYHLATAEGSEEKIIECTFAGNGDIEGTCNLNVEGSIYLDDIPLDCIETTAETIFK